MTNYTNHLSDSELESVSVYAFMKTKEVGYYKESLVCNKLTKVRHTAMKYRKTVIEEAPELRCKEGDDLLESVTGKRANEHKLQIGTTPFCHLLRQ